MKKFNVFVQRVEYDVIEVYAETEQAAITQVENDINSGVIDSYDWDSQGIEVTGAEEVNCQ